MADGSTDRGRAVAVGRALVRVAAGVRRRGLRTTARVVRDRVAEVWFDRRAHVSTTGYVMIEGRGDVGTSTGYHYIGVPPGDLRGALRDLRIVPAGRFVDLGCGKGRGLVIAAQHGFTHLAGVDFMTAFCAAARDNLAAHAAATGRALDVTVLNMDAADFAPSGDDTVFFAFNPFPADVLAAVLDRVEDSVRDAPRPVTLLYLNPLHSDVLDERPSWHETGRTQGRHYETVAYRLT